MKLYSRAVVALSIVGSLGLAGCTGVPQLEVTTAPPAAAEESPTPTPTEEVAPEAERGTRENPLAIGESRKISEKSMWTIGATGPTEVHDGYVVIPLQVGLDWEASRAQTEAAGETWTLDQEGINPYTSLFIEYVTAAGRSYNTMDNYEVTVPNELFMVGTVYPPNTAVAANHSVSVPAGEVDGGVWVVKNLAGETVFVSAR